MNILYLTYDGLSDPLGQSQVLPYLLALSDGDHNITIVSFEKENKTSLPFLTVKKQLEEKKISWIPMTYTKYPPVLSTLYDIIRLKKLCIHLHRENSYHVVHCRSYITSFAGLLLKKKFGLKFIFDMRGFYADERVEGGLWSQQKLIYRRIYHYFKKKEREFLNSADQVVVLTEAARKELRSSFSIPENKLTVIPCCADQLFFDPQKVKHEFQSELKKKLGIQESDFILSYLGAIGTWYLLNEMLDFFKQLCVNYPNARFLFITLHPEQEIIEMARKKNISAEKIMVVRALRNEVPSVVALSNLSVFFIKPSYSKTASSPTKLAELMLMGIPVVCNVPVGDLESIISKSAAGLMIHEFSTGEYEQVIHKIPLLLESDKAPARNYAVNFFSLEKGVASYREIYRTLF